MRPNKGFRLGLSVPGDDSRRMWPCISLSAEARAWRVGKRGVGRCGGEGKVGAQPVQGETPQRDKVIQKQRPRSYLDARVDRGECLVQRDGHETKDQAIWRRIGRAVGQKDEPRRWRVGPKRKKKLIGAFLRGWTRTLHGRLLCNARRKAGAVLVCLAAVVAGAVGAAVVTHARASARAVAAEKVAQRCLVVVGQVL